MRRSRSDVIDGVCQCKRMVGIQKNSDRDVGVLLQSKNFSAERSNWWRKTSRQPVQLTTGPLQFGGPPRIFIAPHCSANCLFHEHAIAVGVEAVALGDRVAIGS